MNGPERLAEAKKRIAGVKSALELGRQDSTKASFSWFDAASKTCDLIEWLLDEAEKDAKD